MSVESSLQNPRSGCSLLLLTFGLLCGVGIAALGVFLLSMVPGSWREMKEMWTEGPGTITAVGVKGRQVRTGNQPSKYYFTTNHFVVLDCKYAVDGKEYTVSELVAPKQPVNTSDELEAVKAASVYQPGEEITVYHHPTEHSQARLEAGGANGLFWMSVIFGPFVVLGGAGLAWWTWLEWRAKKAAAA